MSVVMTNDDKVLYALRDLNRLLAEYVFELPDENAAVLATGMVARQKVRWSELLAPFKNSNQRLSAYLNSNLGALSTTLLRDNLFEVQVHKGGQRIVGRIPIIQREIPDEITSSIPLDPLLFSSLICARCRDFLYSNANEVEASHLISDASRRLLDLTVDEKIRNEVKSLWDSFSTGFSSQIDTFEHQVQSLSPHMNRIEKASQILDGATQQISTIKAEKTELFESIHANNEALLAEAIRRLEEQAREFIKVDASISFWKSKAERHAQQSRIFGFLFTVGLMVVPLGLFFGTFSQYLNKIENIHADHQFLAIALLSVPVLALAWFLRLMAKLLLQNVRLAQDADQRQAMISTYLALLADEKKPITEKERVLALAALFRPLDGTQDEIAPPTVLDLLREAAEGGSSKKL